MKQEDNRDYKKVTDLKRMKFIVDVLNSNISKDAKVLDVGCGNGIISKNLGREGYTTLGIDVSSKAIEKAVVNNAYDHVTFKNLSAEELISEGELYDAIICSEVLEHLNDPDDLLMKLHTSLKEDGVLIVTVPNGNGPRELLITRPMIKISKNRFLWGGITGIKTVLGYSGSTVQSDADNLDHIQFFTKSDVKRMSLKNGFTISDFRNSNFIEEVFPFSFFSNRIRFLQVLDCKVADMLPNSMSSGFLMVWRKL